MAEFAFDGYGVGISGFVNGAIPAQLVGAIPPGGGASESSLSDFRMNRVLRVSRGWVRAVGEGDRGGWEWHSYVEIDLRDCRILEEITIDRIVLRLEATHSSGGGVAAFRAAGSRVENLRVQGRPVEVIWGAEGEFGGVRAEGDVKVAGNTITIPGVGRIRLGVLDRRKERIRLSMLLAELNTGEVRGEIVLASGTLGGSVVGGERERFAEEREREPEPQPEMDEEELEEVFTELRAWASSHPAPGEPFLTLMGEVLTPVEFLAHLEARTRVGRAFLNFLAAQARRNREHPKRMIQRAVEANRP